MDKQELVAKSKREAESKTWTRRSMLSWLGKGTVLALASGGLAGCRGTTNPIASDEWTGCDGDGFEFGPGTCDVTSWRERTIDRQELENILANWQLSVGGLVDNELNLTFDQLVNLPSHNPLVDFHCVEGWSVFDVPWNGVQLGTLLTQAGVQSNATHVNFHTLGYGYNESLPLDVALEANTILAYGVGGSSLSLKHGFPARIVIPKLYGYKSAKYVERIELSDIALEGFWVDKGYSYSGEVPAGRLREGKY